MILTSIPAASSRKRASARSGFSLVEVALAMAIAALAVITLLGLLPQGLEMSRKTGLISSNSSILEQIIRNLENLQWADFPTAVTRKYFTDQGLEVESDSKEISFVVEIDLQQPASLPKSGTVQPYLRRAIIKVGTGSSDSYEFGENNRASYVIFNHLIAKSR